MSINKHQTITVLDRRNKQQILKDFIRPPTSDTVSSPSTGGGSGGTFDGVPQDCSGPGGEPGTGSGGGGGGGVYAEDRPTCAYLWTFSGVHTDPNGNTILSSEDDWFIDRSGVSNGSLSGRPIIMPTMDAVGGLDSVLFGASYSNWDGRTARVSSNCDSGAEDESAIYGTLDITGDYFSDPRVDYEVYGITQSSAYQTTISITPFIEAGNARRLKYYASGRHVYGTLKTEISGRTIIPEWIFDQWVVEHVKTSENLHVLTPTGIVGNVIPYSHILRTDPTTGIRSRTFRIGNWSETSVVPYPNNDLDFAISYERTINWNVGVGNSKHREHFAAAHKGSYSPITVDWRAIHQFFIDPDDYKALPSNSRKALPMERVSVLVWNYPYQDIAAVYNVWVEGLVVPSDAWVWNADGKTLTFTYEISPDTSVLADATVQ